MKKHRIGHALAAQTRSDFSRRGEGTAAPSSFAWKPSSHSNRAIGTSAATSRASARDLVVEWACVISPRDRFQRRQGNQRAAADLASTIPCGRSATWCGGQPSQFFNRTEPDSERLAQSAIDCARFSYPHLGAANEW
jgi:hypothetical protein